MGVLGVVAAVALALPGCGQVHVPQTQAPPTLETQAISWATTTVSDGAVFDTSIALDSSDRPHIAFVEFSSYPLKLLYASYDPDTGQWSSQFVASLERLEVLSLAFDSSGVPHIAFLDFSELKYASPPSSSGTGWTVENVDVGAYVQAPSLAFDKEGYPHISYARYDAATYMYDLYYASRGSGGWTTQLVYSMEDGSVGYGSSLAFDSAGHPHISTRYETAVSGVCGLLYVSYVIDAGSAGWAAPETVDSCNSDVYSMGPSGSASSLALDQDDSPHISYKVRAINRPSVLKYAHRSTDGWQTAEVDSDSTDYMLGDYSSLALDAAGNSHISYGGRHPSSYGLALTHAWYANGAWQREVVDDSLSESGWFTSFAIDQSTDMAYISYVLGDPANLKIAIGTIAGSVTPEEAIANLEATVESLDYLKTGQITGLTKPLDNALRSLDKDKTEDACNQLADFVSVVEGKTPTPLLPDDATALITDVNAIRDDLGCTY